MEVKKKPNVNVRNFIWNSNPSLKYEIINSQKSNFLKPSSISGFTKYITLYFCRFDSFYRIFTKLLSVFVYFSSSNRHFDRISIFYFTSVQNSCLIKRLSPVEGILKHFLMANLHININLRIGEDFSSDNRADDNNTSVIRLRTRCTYRLNLPQIPFRKISI